METFYGKCKGKNKNKNNRYGLMCHVCRAHSSWSIYSHSYTKYANYFTAFFIQLAGLLLGPKLGAASSLVYMITGLIGIPIFTQGGGLGYIFKPSFGYIIGFIIGSYVTGKIASKVAEPSYKRLLTAALTGLIIVYVIGMIYCFFITNFYLGTDMSLKTLFISCFLILIPGDLVLTFLATFLSRRLIPILNREREKR